MINDAKETFQDNVVGWVSDLGITEPPVFGRSKVRQPARRDPISLIVPDLGNPPRINMGEPTACSSVRECPSYPSRVWISVLSKGASKSANPLHVSN